MPAIVEHLTPKPFVDNAIHEIIGYVDNLHEINRNGRDLSSVYNDEDNEFYNKKLTDLDNVIVNRNPTSDNEVSNEKYVGDSIGEGTILRFNKTLENYKKVSVGNDTKNITSCDKIQITDTTIIIYPNTGGYLLQNWVIKCNDKNSAGKIQNFIQSSNQLTPSPDTGANTLPPIGKIFMYIETSSNDHREGVYRTFERTDIIQIGKVSFYYNRYLAEGVHKVWVDSKFNCC